MRERAGYSGAPEVRMSSPETSSFEEGPESAGLGSSRKWAWPMVPEEPLGPWRKVPEIETLRVTGRAGGGLT